MHPMVFHAGINVMGWGPSASLFIWDDSLRESITEFHWRYVRIQRGRLDLTVCWA